jgi:two-component system, NtrC family, response regulator AtoC
MQARGATKLERVPDAGWAYDGPIMERTSGSYELVALTGEQLRVFDLAGRTEVSVGRHESNDVQLDHPSVSRCHARLRLDTNITIEDLGSANGTFVHDRTGGQGKTEKLLRVQAPGAAVTVGESLLLGAVSVVMRHRAAPPDAGALVNDAGMEAVYAQAARAAAATINVLLLGETGVGKEVLARWIHARAHPTRGPFVALNCAAFSEALLEGELFGYEKGAFTGAAMARPGLFEAADGGTLFLDEVGELPSAMQAKFLRVLEERAVLRIGARAPRAITARIIAATNRDLEVEVRAGRFREDLYYRLNGLSLAIPPLRERPDAIVPLARSFVESAYRQLERRPLVLAPETLQLLQRHHWPGNVRELKNVAERAVVLCDEVVIAPRYLPAALNAPGAAEETAAPAASLEAFSPEVTPERFQAQLESLHRARIVEALNRCAGNQTQAAKLLGMARRTLVSQLVELGVPRPRTRARGS